MTELVKAAVLNAVKLNSNAVNVAVAKQLGSRYPNMNKVNNMLMNSIEQVQQMDALMKGADGSKQNPLTALINTLVAQDKKSIEQENPEPEWVKKLEASNTKLHGTVKSLHHRIDAIEQALPPS